MGLAICLPDSVLYVFVNCLKHIKKKYIYVCKEIDIRMQFYEDAPPPRNSQWQVRFIGDPLQKCTNPGGHCYCTGW